MNPRRRWFGLFLLFLFIAVAREPAFAAGEENPAEGPVGMLFRWIHFALVFGTLGYVVARYGPGFFRQRAQAIAASITEASVARTVAEQQLGEAEERLQHLDQDVAELRRAAQRESAAEAERIRALTQDEMAKIRRAAQAEVQAAEQAARIELKALAARGAVERANALIRTRMTARTRAALFQSFLDGLARSVN